MRQAFRLYFLLFLFAAGLSLPARAQAPMRPPLPPTLRLTLLDSVSRAPVIGASVGVPGTAVGGQTDAAGRLTLAPPVGAVLVVNALGYAPRRLRATPGSGETTVLLAPAGEALEEVVVTATRTNSRVEDLPTRVEVIGEDDLVEENGIKPGNISSMLGDLAGTQIQPTSPVTGNADLRIQGLPGRYSFIVRDGLPLLGGFAGGFGILQIPPLDLRQIELIKGASSTLYGGGAIAGLVNLVSKEPARDGLPDVGITVNQTTLRESNVNVFASQRRARVGYTAFGGVTGQQAVDVDGDGFADAPYVRTYTVHPRLFLYPQRAGAQVAVGYTGTFEERRAGDLAAVHHGATAATGYRVDNRTARHSADIIYTRPDSTGTTTVKGLVSDFYRRAFTSTGVDFSAHQLSYYAEVSTVRRWGRHAPVLGLNLTGETVRPDRARPTPLRAAYTYAAPGVFVQDDWQPLGGPLTVQAGLRVDYHNRYRVFVLPRVSLLYRFSPDLTARAGGGLGYRAPVPYTNDLDERQYPTAQPIGDDVRAERAAGFNADINWRRRLTEDAVLTLNQGVFLTRLADPLVLGPDATLTNPAAPSVVTWTNAAGPVRTQGLESYVRLRVHETELYVGYGLTDARRLYPGPSPYVELVARHKFAAVAVQEFGEHFGVGLEASTIGRQYLPDNTPTPGYLLAALMLRYRTGPWTVVLNGENLLDYRQTRRERVVVGERANPGFRPLWAPVEGRVINLSVNWRLPRKAA